MSEDYATELARKIAAGQEHHELWDTCRYLEDEIERRGKRNAYITHLREAVGASMIGDCIWIDDLWAIIRATPEQRAKAFLAATKE